MTYGILAVLSLLLLGCVWLGIRYLKEIGSLKEQVVALQAQAQSQKEISHAITEVDTRPIAVDPSDIDRL